MTAAILLQPLSANDIVAIMATFFAGVVVIVRAFRPTQTAADVKAETLGDQLSGLQDLVTTLTAAVAKVSLAAPPPTKAGTTTTSTTTTTASAAPAVTPAKGTP